MTCTNKDIQELLPAYRERSLDQESEAVVARHLAGCEDCALELTLLRTMASEAVPDPGEAFWAALPGRVYREVQDRKHRRATGVLARLLEKMTPPRLAWPVAVLFLVVITVWSLLPPGQDRPAPLDTAAVGSLDSWSAEDPFDPGQIELADLSGIELDSLDSWASGELAALMGEATDLLTNGQDLSLDDRLAELNTQELEQLSNKLDEYAEEG